MEAVFIWKLPVEVLNLILDYQGREDNELILVYNSCRRWCDIIRKGNKKLVFYPSINRFIGSLPMFIWAKKNGYNYIRSNLIIQKVISKGCLEVLQWLEQRMRIGQNRILVQMAIYHGQLDMVKWLRQRKPTDVPDACLIASRFGRLEVLKYLVAEGFEIGPKCIPESASYGQLEILKYIYEKQGFLIQNRSLCLNATYSGKLEVLKWLRSINTEWNKMECYQVAYRYGYGDMTTWIWSQQE